MKTDTWKNIVIIIIAAAAVLVVSYATFAQPLAVRTATLGGAGGTNNAWDIGFTNVTRTSMTGNAQELAPVDFNSTSATFYVYLGSNGDTISYDFTIKNSGNLDAKVDSIYLVPKNQDTDAIHFTMSGIELNDELKVGETATLKVIASFNPGYNGNKNDLSKSVTIIINYAQK